MDPSSATRSSLFDPLPEGTEFIPMIPRGAEPNAAPDSPEIPPPGSGRTQQRGGKTEDACVFEVRPWEDPVLNSIGIDPLSPYVEKYWTGILGPSATLLVRRLTAELRVCPEGFQIPSKALANELGIGIREGRQGPFWRCLHRAEKFGLLQRHDYVLLVRTLVAPLSSRQIDRLPDHLKAPHRQWSKERRAPRPAPTIQDLTQLDRSGRQPNTTSRPSPEPA